MEEVDGQDRDEIEKSDTSPLLDENDLLHRFKLASVYENAADPAFKKLLYRLRTARGKKHLKSVPVGKNIRYRLADVEEWEAKNARNALLSLVNLSDDDVAEWFDEDGNLA
ncbi:MAG: hypothetical protein DCC44_10470 [Acidobacteria bacterium]|nr:hypothetical protein [Pyrinomonadaceae bacterium]RIJ90530.1 MAG: hypothetical protein DCC44_10470 [Acidobacteriota bacterium]